MYAMFPLRSFRARKTEQCLLLLRRLNACPPYGLNPSQNLHKCSVFRENCKDRTSAFNNGNGVLPRTVSLAGVSPRPSCFSSNAQGEILDEEFSETTNSESLNGENNIGEPTEEISSSESTPTLESMQRKPIDELFKDAVGLSHAEGLEESAIEFNSVHLLLFLPINLSASLSLYIHLWGDQLAKVKMGLLKVLTGAGSCFSSTKREDVNSPKQQHDKANNRRGNRNSNNKPPIVVSYFPMGSQPSRL